MFIALINAGFEPALYLVFVAPGVYSTWLAFEAPTKLSIQLLLICSILLVIS